MPSPSVPSAQTAESVPPQESDAQRRERLQRFGDVPPEKLERIKKILLDYGELEMKLITERRGDSRRDEAERTRWHALQLLEDERLADLLRILTPEEAAEVDMHLSQAGKNLIDSLRELTLTPEERRALWQILKAFDREYGGSGVIYNAGVREQARLAMYDEMRRQLGEERFASFLARDDLAYRRFVNLAAEQNQGRIVADQLWRLRSEFVIRRAEIWTRVGGNAQAAASQIEAVNTEIWSRVAALVGEKAIRESPAPVFDWLPKPR